MMRVSAALSVVFAGVRVGALTSHNVSRPMCLKDILLLDPNATRQGPRLAVDTNNCSDDNGPACHQYNQAMAQAFTALANAGQCGPNQSLDPWTCAECKQAGFDLVPKSMRFVVGREIFDNDSTSILIAQVQGHYPGSQPRPTEQVKHIGEDCWDHCRRTAGYCQWCGVGNACCKSDDARGPEACTAASGFNGSAQHQCVAPKVHTEISADKSSSEETFGCLLSVRGSHNVDNWIMNFLFFLTDMGFGDECPGCQANVGWLTAWRESEEKVMSTLSDLGCLPGGPRGNLIITGHSFGAAVATLAMFHLQAKGYNVVQSYVFESPRVGNTAWSAAFQNFFGRDVPVFRVTHRHDVVPRVPPQLGFLHLDLDFKHVASEVYYPSDDVTDVKVCEDAEDKQCGDRYLWLECMLMDLEFQDHCNGPLGKYHSFCHCPLRDQEAIAQRVPFLV